MTELVVMAAGMGSRYGGLKQLEAVGPAGEVIMDYSVYDAARAGVQRVVFVIRRDIEREFHAALGARYTRTVNVTYAFQELDDVPPGFAVPAARSKPWGTGHAVLAARDAVTAPFVAINADDLYGPEGFALLDKELAAPAPPGSGRYAMVAYRLANTLSEHGAVSRGVCEVGADGSLRGISEVSGVRRTGEIIAAEGDRTLRGDEPVSMNLWGFRPGVFAHLEERFRRFLALRGADPGAEFFLPTAVFGMVEEGLATVTVLDTSSTWLGVTYREDLAGVRRRVAELVRHGVYPSPLWR